MTPSDHDSTSRPRRRRQDERRIGGPDLARRLRAAGLAGDDGCAEDIASDAFRMRLARRIAMILNRWPGCRESLCKRNRGCMAPRGHCSNHVVRPRSEEQERRGFARVQRMLRQELERRKAAAEM